jgi:hypothetical protein
MGKDKGDDSGLARPRNHDLPSTHAVNLPTPHENKLPWQVIARKVNLPPELLPHADLGRRHRKRRKKKRRKSHRGGIVSGRLNGDIGRGVIDLIGVTIVVPETTVLNPAIERNPLTMTRDGRGDMNVVKMEKDDRESMAMGRTRRNGQSDMRLVTKDAMTTMTQKDQSDDMTQTLTTRDPKDATQKTTTNTPAAHPTTTPQKDIPPPPQSGKPPIAIEHSPPSRNETNLPARTGVVIARRDGRTEGRKRIRDGRVFIMRMIWNSRLVRLSRKEIVNDGVEHHPPPPPR